MIISQITAISRNRVIGKNNTLPWDMPDDMAYFNRLTMGHYIVLGRKNYESNKKALPGRTNIVLTRNQGWSVPDAIVLHDLDDAIELAKKNGEEELFIIGGGEIYRLSLPVTQRIYLTLIDTEVEGDVTYPELSADQWKMVSADPHPADQHNPYPYTFYIYDRIK